MSALRYSIYSMKHLAIAIAGRMGTGKTTLATALSDHLGWPRASFGDYVRSEVARLGMPLSRHNLQTVGTELLTADVAQFCHAVLATSGWTSGQGLIIDGLRHSETIEPISTFIHPLPLKVVLIKVQEEIRRQRLAHKGEVNELAVREADSHSSEKQVATIFDELADLILDGTQQPKAVFEDVVRWIQEQ